MASTKTRQRKLERDRYERKMVRRAQQQRRRRRVQAGVGAFLALAVLGVGTAWLTGALDGLFAPAEEETPVADRCFWDDSRASEPGRVDAGSPDGNPPTSGTQTVTMELAAADAGSGSVVFEMNLDDEPCGAGSLAHLATEGFYDGTVCHEITESGALRCGDPSGTGAGGSSYVYYGQNFPYGELDEAGQPVGEEVRYPAGTVALADTLGANDSQLLIFYEDFAPDGALWPILGTVTSGLDLLEAIGAAGVAADGEAPGPPAQDVRVVSVTVSEPAPGPEPDPADADSAPADS